MGDPVEGTVATATLVTVTGTGFPGGQDNIIVGYISLGKSVSASNFIALTLIKPSLLSSTTPSGEVLADANGWFTAQFYVPELQAGTYSIVAEYTPSGGAQTLTTAASFTVNTKLAVLDSITGAPSSIYGAQVDVVATGFDGAETPSFAPSSIFTTTQYGSIGFSTFTLGSNGATTTSESALTGREVSGISTNIAYVANHKAGAAAISVTGGTSSLSATTTFTLVPSVAFLTSGGVTTLSIPSTGGALKVEGFNFPSSATIPTNSITLTVGSTTTSAIMVSVTTDNDGYFAPTAFTVTQTMPTGLVSVGLNGTAYNWSNANIQPPSTASWAGATGLIYADEAFPYQGVLISSNTAGPAYVLTDTSTYWASSTLSYPAFFGINFPASVTSLTSATYAPTAGSAAALALDGGSAGLNGFATANVGTSPDGAFFAWPAAEVLPASFSTNNIFTVIGTGGGVTATGTAAINIAQAAMFNNGAGSLTTSTLTISSGQSGVVPFNRVARQTTYNIEVTGFKEMSGGALAIGTPDAAFTATLTDSSGVATTWATITGVTTACAANTAPANANPAGTGTMCVNTSPGFYIFNLGAAPEVAGGSYTLTISGTSSGNTASIGVIVDPLVLGSALSLTSATPGQTVSFATTTTAGVHGLLPNTAYTAWFDGSSGTSVATFTSTANGQVPPGTQFAVPAGASGVHVVDIAPTGSTSSALFGQTIPRVSGSAQYTGYTAPVTTASTSNTGTQGLTLTVSGAASLAPNVGAPGITVSVSASGLTPNTAYYVVLSTDVTYASFTSTSTGTVPAGVTFAFPNFAVTAGNEQGQAVTVYLSSKASHTNGVASSATFILQSSMSLSNSTAPAGGTLSVKASALANGQTYNIIFNYGINSQGTAFTGTTVGAIVGGTDGTATGQFTVPASASAGAYTIQLVRSGCGTGTTCAALVSPPTLTVGAASTSGLSTNTLAASGSAAEATVNGQATVSQGFTNTGTSSLSVYEWVSVMNSAGQTVGVFLGSGTIGAGQTVTLGAALFNLPSGSYTATVFVTTSSGIVVSSTSTTASFSV